MRFKTTVMLGLALVLTIPVFPSWGADYSTYSTDELAATRGTLRDAPAEEHAAFAKKWQDRPQIDGSWGEKLRAYGNGCKSFFIGNFSSPHLKRISFLKNP